MYYLFGCFDTTTHVMNYLTKKECKPILCLNNDCNAIKKHAYFKQRTIKNFVITHKRLKCHLNENYCYKVSHKELVDNQDKYIGETIQFLLKPWGTSVVSWEGTTGYYEDEVLRDIDGEPIFPVLWECKLLGLSNPNDLSNFKNGITVAHIGKIGRSYNPQNENIISHFISSEDAYTFFDMSRIYKNSLRILYKIKIPKPY